MFCLEKIFFNFSLHFFFRPVSLFPPLYFLTSCVCFYICLPPTDDQTTVILGYSCMTSYPFPWCLAGSRSDAMEHDREEPEGLGLNGAEHLSPPATDH